MVSLSTEATRTEPKKKASFVNLAVVENKQGEVLCIRRVVKETGKDGSTLEWAFPGGRQEEGETREACVAREVLVETGYTVKPLRQLNIRMHPQLPACIVYHLCALNESAPVAKPKEPHEVAEVRWVRPEILQTLITTKMDPVVAKTLRIEPTA